jgi:hypothetical protein
MNAYVQTFHAGNDAILQRLDHEHLVAFQETCRLMEADNGEGDDDGGVAYDYPEWKVMEALARAAECLPATSLAGLKSKTRILARQGRALTVGEMLFKEGDILKRLAASVLQDALDLYGADYAEPDSEPASENP